MTRNVRQIKILEIIKNHNVRTQEELVDYLEKNNFKVTQATISRDIKELGLVKVCDGVSKYRYAYTKDINQKTPNRLHNLFKESVSEINFANNIVVIKTIVGSAQSAAAMVDTLQTDGILGTVAGDDTVIVVAKSNEMAKLIVDELEELTL